MPMRHREVDYRVMKVKQLIQMIERDGWFLVRVKGSHRQYHHQQKPGTVTIAGKLSHDMATGTAKSILKQSGLD